MRSSELIPVLYLLSGLSLAAATLDVSNDFGAIRIEVVAEQRLMIDGLIREPDGNRPALEEDTLIQRRGDRLIVACRPPDGAGMDITVRLPLGYSLEARTKDGELSVTGMIERVRLSTDAGSIHLRLPWRGTRLQLDADVKPPELTLPPGRRFLDSVLDISGGRTLWRLRDNLPDRAVVHGTYRIRAGDPRSVILEEFEPPPDWPLKFHWEAPDVLESILQPPPRPERLEPDPGDQTPAADGGATFRSDVRMVNLVLAVSDAAGEPVTDLRPEEVQVVEDGEVQDVAFAGSDQAPFNLAILLDLSGSTRPDRAPMQAAVEGFIDLAGENDRVAIYALSGGMFHVVSRLTSDRVELNHAVKRIPEVTGASPLYDVMTLAYAEELHQRPGERNALIVVTDGIDNQVSKQEAPSSVKFKRLRQAAQEMNALIYPVFLLSGERFGRNWSQAGAKRMQELTSASGGRMFPAASVEDLTPVFPRVAAELRSVYSVAYYPKNQEFDGAWRSVDVRLTRSGAVLRTRPGYYAR